MAKKKQRNDPGQTGKHKKKAQDAKDPGEGKNKHLSLRSRLILVFFVFAALFVSSLCITSLSKWVLALRDKPKPLCMSQAGVNGVVEWVQSKNMGQYTGLFEDNYIRGSLLLMFHQEAFQNLLGIDSEFHARYLSTELEILRNSSIGAGCPIPVSEQQDPRLAGASDRWNTDQVLIWLGLDMDVTTEISESFKRMSITGHMLPYITLRDLKTEFEIEDRLTRLRLYGAIISLPAHFTDAESQTSHLIQALLGHTTLLIVWGLQQGFKGATKSKGFKNLLTGLLKYLDVAIFLVLCAFGFFHLLFSVHPDLILNLPTKSTQKLLLSIYSAMSARKGYQILRNVLTIFVFHYGGIFVSKILGLVSGAIDRQRTVWHVSEGVVVLSNHTFLLGVGLLDNYGFSLSSRNWSRLLFSLVGPSVQFLMLFNYIKQHVADNGTNSASLIINVHKTIGSCVNLDEIPYMPPPSKPPPLEKKDKDKIDKTDKKDKDDDKGKHKEKEKEERTGKGREKGSGDTKQKGRGGFGPFGGKKTKVQ